MVLLNVDTLVGLPLVMSGGGGGSGAFFSYGPSDDSTYITWRGAQHNSPDMVI